MVDDPTFPTPDTRRRARVGWRRVFRVFPTPDAQRTHARDGGVVEAGGSEGILGQKTAVSGASIRSTSECLTRKARSHA